MGKPASSASEVSGDQRCRPTTTSKSCWVCAMRVTSTMHWRLFSGHQRAIRLNHWWCSSSPAQRLQWAADLGIDL